MKWRQKSRDLWLREGDRNSKKFHLSTPIRCRRNFISEIRDNNGHWFHSREEIEQYFTENFTGLFNSSRPTIPVDLDNLFNHYIVPEENVELFKVPTPQEIKEVI